MILHLLKSKQGLVGFAAVALLGLAGCDSEAMPSSSGSEAGGSIANRSSEIQAVGKLTASYLNGHLTFGALRPATTGTPGVATQGFGPFTENLLTFDTDPGDGVGTGSCTSTQYCATVGLTNNTARIMQNVFTEILDYTDIQPPTATISWAGTPFTRSSAYASVFKNSGAIEAANYGDFTSGERKTVEFKFNVGAATNFAFDVTTYATFPRTQAIGSFYNNVSAANACATSGSVAITSADDVEVPYTLPFPITLADLTYDQAIIGSNGYMLLYKTGNPAPTVNPTGPNQTLFQGGFPQGFYPFWDDLAFDPGDGVCAAVTGTAPSRTLTVTWANAKISTDQPGKTFSAEKITYSVVINESYDNIQFIYNLPTAITDLTRGGSATIGIYDISRGQDQAFFYGYNSPSVPPASAASYPSSILEEQYNRNP